MLTAVPSRRNLLTAEARDADAAPAPSTARRRSKKAVTALGLGAVLVALLVGNLVILSMSLLARSSVAEPIAPAVTGIKNFRAVDDVVLRGAAPGREGYESLAAAGVTTVVDLRAEENLLIDHNLLGDLGITRVAIPIRDGQTPTPAEVRRFLDVVGESDGLVFVHCGAGVGRTGAMAAAYLVSTGMSPSDALKRNLAVGPPSLEQVSYAADLDAATFERPGPVLTAASRVLDAPRRLWSRYGL